MAKGRPISAWQQARLDAEAARGLYGGNRWNGTQWVTANGSPVQRPPKPPNPFGKQGSLSKQLDKQLQREVNQAVARSCAEECHAARQCRLHCLRGRHVGTTMCSHVRFFRGGTNRLQLPRCQLGRFSLDMVSHRIRVRSWSSTPTIYRGRPSSDWVSWEEIDEVLRRSSNRSACLDTTRR